MTHMHNAAGNSRELLRELRGHKIVGILVGELPGNSVSTAGNRSLVLDCGYAFTFNGTGAYWLESPGDVQRAIERIRARLAETELEQKVVAEMAEGC